MVQRSAGRLLWTGEGLPEFRVTRMQVSCGHCLKTYIVRVDRTGEPVFSTPGPSAGVAGFVANETVKPETPMEEEEPDSLPPMDAAAAVELLRRDPLARLA